MMDMYLLILCKIYLFYFFFIYISGKDFILIKLLFYNIFFKNLLWENINYFKKYIIIV